MCFSATASFTSAALLIPAGAYCLAKANCLDKPYWAFAMLPILFGLQQTIEGGIWLSLQAGEAESAHRLALGFLLFSHLFWLGWVPYSAYLTESSPRLRRAFLLIVLVGLLLGAAMYLPLLNNPAWVSVSIVEHSIDYELKFISDAYVSQQMVTILYLLVILVPLMLSSDLYHRSLGLLVFLSGLAAWLFFDWVFVSVWCYFAAIISLYIFFIIVKSEAAVDVARN